MIHPDENTVTIVSAVLGSVGALAGFAKWGIGKYFQKSDELQKIKEQNIIHAVSVLTIEVKESSDKNIATQIKLGSLETTVKSLVKSSDQYQKNQKLMIESNFESLEAVKKTLDRLEVIEAKINSPETSFRKFQNKR